MTLVTGRLSENQESCRGRKYKPTIVQFCDYLWSLFEPSLHCSWILKWAALKYIFSPGNSLVLGWLPQQVRPYERKSENSNKLNSERCGDFSCDYCGPLRWTLQLNFYLSGSHAFQLNSKFKNIVVLILCDHQNTFQTQRILVFASN